MSNAAQRRLTDIATMAADREAELYVYVVTGEHWEVLNLRTSHHASEAGANLAAAEMVNMMLSDLKLAKNATAENWLGRLRVVQRTVRADDGEAECNVLIEAEPLKV